MYSMSPVSSMTSSPMAPKQPIDIDDISDFDNDFENDDINDDDYDNNDVRSPTIVPVHSSLTTIEIVRLPAKGITAWLAHLQRKERRESIMDKLRSLVF